MKKLFFPVLAYIFGVHRRYSTNSWYSNPRLKWLNVGIVCNDFGDTISAGAVNGEFFVKIIRYRCVLILKRIADFVEKINDL